MFERLTDRAKTMALANLEAQRFNHEYIGTEHILLGLIKEGSGVGCRVLKDLNVDLGKLRLEIERLIKASPMMVTLGKLPQTPRAKKVIEYAIMEARSLHHGYVGTGHLLLGLLREDQGVAKMALQSFGVTIDKVRPLVAKSDEQVDQVSHDVRQPLEPFRVPQKLSLAPFPVHPVMACLTDEQGHAVSPPMRIELAEEIVKRYNAH